MICKCYNCDKHIVGCHATCADYKEYKAARQTILDKIHRDSEIKDHFAGAVVRRKENYNKHSAR